MAKQAASPAEALPLIADILSDRTDIVMCKVSSGVLEVADDVLGQLGLRIGHCSALKILKRAEALAPEIDERAFAPLSPAERNTLNKLLLRLARSGQFPRPESSW